MMARKGVCRGGGGLEAPRVSMELLVFGVIKLSIERPTEKNDVFLWRVCVVLFGGFLFGCFFWCGVFLCFCFVCVCFIVSFPKRQN